MSECRNLDYFSPHFPLSPPLFFLKLFIFVVCGYSVCGYTDVSPQYVGVREVCRGGSWCCWEGRAAVPSSPWSFALISSTEQSHPLYWHRYSCVHWDTWWSEELTPVKIRSPPVPCATAGVCCLVGKEGITLGVGGATSREGRHNHCSQLQLQHTVAPNTCQTAVWEIFRVQRIHPLLLSAFEGQSLKFHTQLAPC